MLTDAILAAHRGTTPIIITPGKDWFDMATKKEVGEYIDERLLPTIAQWEKDTRTAMRNELLNFVDGDVVMQLNNTLFRMIADDEGNIRRRYITEAEYPGLQEARQVRSGPWTDVSAKNEGWFRRLPHIPVLVGGVDVTPF